MRAALLYGPQDLRVEEVPEPEGEVLVQVEAATTCGTDTKMWRHGHRILPPYPCAFGHETAGVRTDTGDRVLVSDSVACGSCAPCRAGRAQICRDPRWVLGGFAEYISAPEQALHPIPDGLPAHAAAMAEPLAAAVHAVDRGSDATDVGIVGGGPMGQMLAALLVAQHRTVTVADPHPERRAQALHPIPDGLPAHAAAMAEPLAAAVHAVDRASDATDVGIVGGGPMGQMLAALLIAQSRTVTVADPHPERRAQAAELGALPATRLTQHELVFEAVGRPEAWRDAAAAAAPGAVVVLVGGCPSGTEVTLDPGPLHYEELELRGTFHHDRADVDRALANLAAGTVPWQTLQGPTVSLNDLPTALAAPNRGPALKWVVDPRR